MNTPLFINSGEKIMSGLMGVLKKNINNEDRMYDYPLLHDYQEIVRAGFSKILDNRKRTVVATANQLATVSISNGDSAGLNLFSKTQNSFMKVDKRRRNKGYKISPKVKSQRQNKNKAHKF